jgi:hypothetical protein
MDVESCLLQPLWLAGEDHLHLDSSSPTGLGVFICYIIINIYMGLGNPRQQSTLWFDLFVFVLDDSGPYTMCDLAAPQGQRSGRLSREAEICSL